MKRTFTITRTNASETYHGGLATLIIIFTLLLSPWQNLAAQSDCCPEFILRDAGEICPPEGACRYDGSTIPLWPGEKLKFLISTVSW